MKLEIFPLKTTIAHAPMGRDMTSLSGPTDKRAWNRALCWLMVKSPRFQRIMSDIDSYTRIPVAYVVICDDAFSQGKFFTPEETNASGWPAFIRGKPVIVISLRGCVAVSLMASRMTVQNHIGENNSDLFGGTKFSSSGVCVGSTPIPDGWEYTRNSRLEKDNGVQSPLVGIAHEVGHLWQWMTWRNSYDACFDRAVKGNNQYNLRLEIHNIINNESQIAFEMGEAVRFHYEYGTTFLDDFAYRLPEPTENATLPLLQKPADNRFVHWPTTKVRAYDTSQMGVNLKRTGPGLVKLDVNRIH